MIRTPPVCTNIKRTPHFVHLCRLVLGVTVTLWPTWASGQGIAYFCQFDETQGAVICVKIEAGNSTRVFQYNMADLDVASLANLAQPSGTNGETSFTPEQCQKIEEFRIQEIEARFHGSLKGLRTTAEKLRRQSEENLFLYKQVILVYRGLFGRYDDGIQTYKQA